MLLYLNLIEAVDGIQTLITESSAVPAVPIVRGAFETLLSMEYIVEADTERRALSWFAATIRDQLHYLESHDPDTPEGKSLEEKLKADKYLGSYELPTPDGNRLAEFRQRAEYWRTVLQNEPFTEVGHALSQVKGKGKRKVPLKWYELFGGPTNVRQLAKHLGCLATYDELYANWSAVVHGQGIAHLMGAVRGAVMEIEPLRSTKAIRSISLYAATFLLRGTQIMDQNFHPAGEPVQEWYAREAATLVGFLSDPTKHV